MTLPNSSPSSPRLVRQPAHEHVEPLFPTARLLKPAALEAQEMLDRAHQTLEDARDQARQIVDQAQADAQSVRQIGINQARQEAATQFVERLQSLDNQAQALRQRFAQDVTHTALRLARKILHVEFRLDPDRIVDLVRQVLRHAKSYQQISVHLHPDHLESVAAHEKPLLEQLPLANTIAFVPDPQLPKTGVRVETEMGAYDGSIDSQMDQLEKQLRQPHDEGPSPY